MRKEKHTKKKYDETRKEKKKKIKAKTSDVLYGYLHESTFRVRTAVANTRRARHNMEKRHWTLTVEMKECKRNLHIQKKYHDVHDSIFRVPRKAVGVVPRNAVAKKQKKKKK